MLYSNIPQKMWDIGWLYRIFHMEISVEKYRCGNFHKTLTTEFSIDIGLWKFPKKMSMSSILRKYLLGCNALVSCLFWLFIVCMHHHDLIIVFSLSLSLHSLYQSSSAEPQHMPARKVQLEMSVCSNHRIKPNQTYNSLFSLMLLPLLSWKRVSPRSPHVVIVELGIDYYYYYCV